MNIGRSKKDAPCKDCPNRYVGCHSKCGDYLLYRSELDEHNKTVRLIKGGGKDDYAVLLPN